MRLVLAAVALVGRAVCENVSYAYAPLDAVVGDRMAQMVGFESLDELAGPCPSRRPAKSCSWCPGA